MWADGPFCPWAPGIKGCPQVYPAGVYLIDDKGKILKDGRVTNRTDLVEYEPQRHNRGCKQFLKSSQGHKVACSPNFLIDTLNNAPNDEYYSELWGLSDKGVSVEKAWKQYGSDSRLVKVAIIDTGVNCSHPDIQCVAEYNAITDEEGSRVATDENGHGTHVAGTACASGGNNIGVSGVSQGCQIHAVKFMDANGSGSLLSAARAVQWAINNDIHIINASWGGPAHSNVLEKAIQKADDAGILFVVAAGNEATNIDTSPRYPASYNYSNVVTVASHTNRGQVSWFSNVGAETVEVIAPGSNILSLDADGGYVELSGTSMATPHVVGFASLLWQKYAAAGIERRQAMLAVREELLNNVVGENLEAVKYGKLQAVEKNVEPGLCRANKCKKCIQKCNEKYDCKCTRLVRCRKECREQTGCKGGCK